MRPDQILMIAVGLLGGYAVYRLATAPKDQAPLPATAFDPSLRFANPAGVSR